MQISRYMSYLHLILFIHKELINKISLNILSGGCYLKGKIKKIKILSVMTSLLLLGNSISVFANEQKLYQAYSQRAETFQTSIYRVVDGKGADGKDNIVYCYDHEYNMPGIKEGDDNEKTYYTKIKSYLESNDPYTEKYGKEKNKELQLC